MLIKFIPTFYTNSMRIIFQVSYFDYLINLNSSIVKYTLTQICNSKVLFVLLNVNLGIYEHNIMYSHRNVCQQQFEWLLFLNNCPVADVIYPCLTLMLKTRRMSILIERK